MLAAVIDLPIVGSSIALLQFMEILPHTELHREWQLDGSRAHQSVQPDAAHDRRSPAGCGARVMLLIYPRSDSIESARNEAMAGLRSQGEIHSIDSNNHHCGPFQIPTSSPDGSVICTNQAASAAFA